MIFSILDEADREKMINIRKGAEKSLLEPDLVAPHETFALGLASLKLPVIPQPERTGIRAIELVDDVIKFMYEVYPQAGAQMFQDKVFLNDYQRALERIADIAGVADIYTVQTLRIPALHIDALWLHDKANENNDKYVPVRTLHGLEKNRLYERSQFFSIVVDAAATANPVDDESGG